MKRIIVLFIVLLFLSATGCSLFVPMEKPAYSGNRLILWIPGAFSVQVISDWNEWGGTVSAGSILDPLSGRMSIDDSGFWTLDISGLSAGVYRYAFLVNGYKWTRDPMNPETAVFNGETVSVIMVHD